MVENLELLTGEIKSGKLMYPCNFHLEDSAGGSLLVNTRVDIAATTKTVGRPNSISDVVKHTGKVIDDIKFEGPFWREI